MKQSVSPSSLKTVQLNSNTGHKFLATPIRDDLPFSRQKLFVKIILFSGPSMMQILHCTMDDTALRCRLIQQVQMEQHMNVVSLKGRIGVREGRQTCFCAAVDLRETWRT